MCEDFCSTRAARCKKFTFAPAHYGKLIAEALTQFTTCPRSTFLLCIACILTSFGIFRWWNRETNTNCFGDYKKHKTEAALGVPNCGPDL